MEFNKDNVLDALNKITELQKSIAVYATLNQEFAFANVQLEMGYRCLCAGLNNIQEVPHAVDEGKDTPPDINATAK